MFMALVAAAISTASYSPVGKWTLDYQQDLCMLTRPYEANGNKATLGFRQAPGDFQTEIIVLLADTPDEALRRGIVSMGVPGSNARALTVGVSMRVPGGRQRLLRFVGAHADVIGFGSQSSVTIEEGGQPATTFVLDRADKALGALMTCEIEQIKSWGVDLSQMAVPAKPIGDATKWFVFPLEAAQNRQAGDTTVRWMIDTQGAVNTCTVVRSSGNPVLDGAACKQIAKRGRYRPAIGKDGKPMASVETRHLIWSIAG